ncbi:SDR family oxidoreductase [Aliishimia ponticola]|uniref:SDR family oxidoreductase n=1 Tax=Aliishimia ponticola TaxID=2499833 RepID=A0A4S4NBY0_9RHOB|nr:SDR family oxidoreductase [Aliishimia ponticola]THH36859.1 SDR family oxidoreductase [Aliishimia ponticola]
MSFSIAGKTAIITGAANGIGLAVARHFAEAGANVMCADLDEAALVSNFQKAREEEDDTSNLRYFAGDLRERLTIANLISATIDAFDTVDILVNASRQFALTDLSDPEDDSVDTLLEQNMGTALKLSQAVARRMIKQAEDQEEGPVGTIINLSSIMANRTREGLMGYSISAAAVNQMTRSLALALAPNRIRVNAVALGSVMSASMQVALRENPEWRDQIAACTPLGKIGNPSDLTHVIQFLASDASAFITGDILTVDGGRSLLDPVEALAH